MHTTGAFYFKPNGEMVNQALPNLEELKAVVDEAHRSVYQKYGAIFD